MIEDILKSLGMDDDMMTYVLSIFTTAKEDNEDIDFVMVEEMLESAGVVNCAAVIDEMKTCLGVKESDRLSEDMSVQLLTSKMTLKSGEVESSLPPPPKADKNRASVKPPSQSMKEDTTECNTTKTANLSSVTLQSKQEWEAEVALQESLDDTDSFATAWQECVSSGKKWGGRGFGGRGVARRYQYGSGGRDVVVDGVTLAFAGKQLLNRTTLRLVGGHRYALLGRNGVGKSTLLRRIAAGALPGFPPHLIVSYLAQEPKSPVGDAAQLTSLDTLIHGACKKRRVLLEMERDTLENVLEAGCWEGDERSDDNSFDEVAIAERLSEVDDEIESLSAANGAAQEKCYKMLQELGFDENLIHTQVGKLSGGWRMRVELAAALIAQADVLLLDEPTNHLDLKGVLWLEARLVEGSNAASGSKNLPTILVVSHDRAFVQAVATDIILMANENLNYFEGGLEAYEQREMEKAIAHEHRLDARVRQETAARESAAKIKAKAQKTGNDNALRAAKQKLAKVDRIGLYRDDGKRFKTHSLEKLDEKYILLPNRVEGRVAAKNDVFKLPVPPPRPIDRALVSLDEVTLMRGDAEVLRNVKAFLYPNTRVAIVGDNGAGKTTLLQALVGHLDLAAGKRYETPGVKIAYVSQHHADELMKCCEDQSEGAATMLSRIYSVSELEARAHLGKFGISGDAALRPMNSLSGGQRVRVSLTSITWDSPDVLLLDEPTNHCDMSALDALAAALKEFPGAVAVVSHNRSFLTACCNELWVIENKRLQVERPPPNDVSPDAFAKLFSDYASRALGNGTGGVGSAQSSNSRASKAAAILDSNIKAKTKRGKAAPGSSAALI